MALYTTPVFNINLKKLAANYRLLEKLSAPAIPAAVVKDDAYGLGAAEVAAAPETSGVAKEVPLTRCVLPSDVGTKRSTPGAARSGLESANIRRFSLFIFSPLPEKSAYAS